VVDARLRAAPRIFAAGDVARVFSPRYGGLLRSEHWTTALAHGGLAAAGVLGDGDGSDEQDLPYVWTEQYDVRICALGVTAGRRPVVVDRHPTEDRFVVAYTDLSGRLDGVLTWNWTRMLAPWRARVAAGERLAGER
jgi:3-phenylpropionate/trans-cinnamate dioxygenase ferredoxin reductase component